MTPRTRIRAPLSLSPLAAMIVVALAACDPPAPKAVEPAPQRQALRLAPAVAGDVIAPPPSADAPPVAAEVDRAPVSMSWPIDQAKQELDERPPIHRAKSRAYWQVSGAEALAAGVPLTISEAGALLKLSASDGAPITDLVLITPEGEVIAADDALVPLAEPTHLTDIGAGFPPGTSLFTLRPELGAGVFTLRATSAAAVLIYVLERASTIDLSLEPSSMIAFTGDALGIDAELRDGDERLDEATLSGAVISPDGARSAFILGRAGGGVAHAEIVLPSHEGPPGSLTTVQVEAVGTTRAGVQVRRTVTHAIAIGHPSARLSGAATRELLGDGGVQIDLDLELGAASRYGASAVLYGDVGGALRPVAVAQAAQWLDPGAGSLVLTFAAADLAGATPPYELRDLRLVDQGRVHVLHRQAKALTLAAAP